MSSSRKKVEGEERSPIPVCTTHLSIVSYVDFDHSLLSDRAKRGPHWSVVLHL